MRHPYLKLQPTDLCRGISSIKARVDDTSDVLYNEILRLRGCAARPFRIGGGGLCSFLIILSIIMFLHK